MNDKLEPHDQMITVDMLRSMTDRELSGIAVWTDASVDNLGAWLYRVVKAEIERRISDDLTEPGMIPFPSVGELCIADDLRAAYCVSMYFKNRFTSQVLRNMILLAADALTPAKLETDAPF